MRPPRIELRHWEIPHLGGTLLDNQVIHRDKAGGVESQERKHQVDPVQAKSKLVLQSGEISSGQTGAISNDERPLAMIFFPQLTQSANAGTPPRMKICLA